MHIKPSVRIRSTAALLFLGALIAIAYLGLTVGLIDKYPDWRAYIALGALIIFMLASSGISKIARREPAPLVLATANMHAVDNLSGRQFERFVADLLPKHGFADIRLTEHFDQGIDIIATKDDVVWGMQLKRHTGQVGTHAIQQVVTALVVYGCSRGMVITNSYFTRNARRLAEANHVALIDRDKLKAILAKPTAGS